MSGSSTPLVLLKLEVKLDIMLEGMKGAAIASGLVGPHGSDNRAEPDILTWYGLHARSEQTLPRWPLVTHANKMNTALSSIWPCIWWDMTNLIEIKEVLC